MSAERPLRARVQSQSFRVSGWWVDPDACRIARDGEELHLEPKVIQVRVHLAERRGQVVSRREFEQLVWTGTVVGYEAVTNAVIKLHKALDHDARHPEIIETISRTRGTGSVLQPPCAKRGCPKPTGECIEMSPGFSCSVSGFSRAGIDSIEAIASVADPTDRVSARGRGEAAPAL